MVNRNPFRAPGGRLITRFAVLALSLLTFGHLVTGASAQAQPPNRFYGTVKVDSKDQPVGTVVDAYVGSTLCGSGSVQDRNGSVIYVVDVLGGGQKPGCAKDGDTVTFKVAGLSAKEKGTYQTGTATRLDLTASGTPQQEATQTVLPAGGGATPAPSPTLPPVVPATSPPVPPTQAAAAPATPSGSPAATGAVSATPTAAGAPATPSPTASVTVPAAALTPTSVAGLTSTRTPEATATGTPHPVIAAAPLIKRTPSSGPPAAVWALIAVAALAAIGGIGAWFYRQRAGV